MRTAGRDQYDNPDYRDDVWRETSIPGGTKLYRLDFLDEENGKIDGSTYFIDEQALIDGDYISFDDDGNQHFNVEKYCDDYQIAPHEPDSSYKNHLSAYEVPEGCSLPAEEGYAENNWEYGHGGGRQLFLDEEMVGELKPIDEGIEIDEDLRRVDSAPEMIDNHKENDDVYKEGSFAPMEEQANTADEIAANKPEKEEGETMKDIADQAELPETSQSTGQENEQGEGQENSATPTENAPPNEESNEREKVLQNESDVPETTPPQEQGNEQVQEENNAMSM